MVENHRVDNKAQTKGFRGVRADGWNFHRGGEQAGEKWLKDRKGRRFSNDDIAHYHKIVNARPETIRLKKEIDNVIERHGGWSGPSAGEPAVDSPPAPAGVNTSKTDPGLCTEDELPPA